MVKLVGPENSKRPLPGLGAAPFWICNVVAENVPGLVALSIRVSRSPLLPTICTGTLAWPARAESVTVKLTEMAVGPAVHGAVGEMVTVVLHVKFALTLPPPPAPEIGMICVTTAVPPGAPENAALPLPVALALAVAPAGIQAVMVAGGDNTTAVVNTGLVKLQDPLVTGEQPGNTEYNLSAVMLAVPL